jgi:adenylate kinase family enzyme
MGQAGSVQRVAIVGSGGAGKSTFAMALGEVTGLPVFHLDRFFWRPGWVETPREEWRRRQTEIFAGDRWIADGNYGGTFDERFAHADTVIIVARARLACVTSAFWRSARNHGKAVQADGCPERFQLEFYRWIWNYGRDSRPRLGAALARHEHLDIIELTSRKSMNDFLARTGAR